MSQIKGLLQLNHPKATLGIVSVGLAALYFIYVSMSEPKGTWKTVVQIPQSIIDREDSVKIEERLIDVQTNGKTFPTRLKEVNPNAVKGFSVLFLHGMGSSSEVWEKVNSLQLIGAMGVRGMAVNLPGPYKNIDKPGFLDSLIKQEKLHRPIIVSPSMSGSYSLPYLLRPNPQQCHKRALAYIPIAPVQTNSYKESEYRQCAIPTLIVYGTKDMALGVVSTRNLRNMKNSNLAPMENTGHVCYEDNSKEWNTILYNFLITMSKQRA